MAAAATALPDMTAATGIDEPDCAADTHLKGLVGAVRSGPEQRPARLLP